MLRYVSRRVRPTLPSVVCALATLALLAACTEDAVSPAAPAGVQPPATAVRRALGLVEVTITGIGTGGMTASVHPAAPTGASAAAPELHLDLTTVPGSDSSIQLEPVSTGSFTDGVRGSGGQRYVHATFRVRNADQAGTAYATPRTNLTFLAVATSSTLEQTAISQLELFDGGSADAGIAPEILPTGAVERALSGSTVVKGADVLQVLTETEAASFTPPSSVTTVFPYGFVVRNAIDPASRTLPASPAPDQFDGVVTFAFKVPLQASASDDPFAVSIMFLAVDDNETRITESLEEQGTTSVQTGADALGSTTGVTLLGNSATTVTGHGIRRICTVRTAGTDPADPAATLVNVTTGCTAGLVNIPSNVIAVDADAAAGGDGHSWDNAFTTLQDALACVRDDAGAGEACEGATEIWVAEGSYFPDQGAGITDDDQDASFELVEGVSLYGGFAGGEYDRDQRNWTANVTTLDGGIDSDDGITGNSSAVLAVNASAGAAITRATVVDGFTVSDALTGVRCRADGAGSECSPTLGHVIVTGHVNAGMNIEATDGATASPLLEDMTFTNNTAIGGGGLVIETDGGTSLPVIVRATFADNEATSNGGGAIFASRATGDNLNLALYDVAFRHNVAITGAGGAINWAGGNLGIVNATFFHDSTSGTFTGGAIALVNGRVTLVNATLAGNGASASGGAIDGGNVPGGGIAAAVELRNTIIWGNGPTPLSNIASGAARFSVVEDGCSTIFTTCDNVLDTDPSFADLASGDLRLADLSPAIDAGSNTLLPVADTFDLDGDGNTIERLPLDLAGNARVSNGTVDVGAYEKQ